MKTATPYRELMAYTDGVMIYATEREALIAAIRYIIDGANSSDDIVAIFEKASQIAPLVLRAVALNSMEQAAR